MEFSTPENQGVLGHVANTSSTNHTLNSFSSNESGESSSHAPNSIFDTSFSESINLVGPYIEDPRNVEPDKFTQYLLMLARGIHESIPKSLDISSVEVLKQALEYKLITKKSIALTKPLACQELKRRDPEAKPNKKNKKLEDLFGSFDDDFLSDADKDYIKTKTSLYLDQLQKGIEECRQEKTNSGGRIEISDRLRYILMIDLCEDIREAYLRSQDTMSRQELDARNSDVAVPDFHDLAVNKFNDATWVPETTPNPDLHSYFENAIKCEKREYYSLTREKSKQLLLDMRHKVNEICKRYDESGNGAAQWDSDTEGNENDEEEGTSYDYNNDYNFGRFNAELARLKGGDDRHNFLKHNSVDLLYWWDVLDRNDLIHFTTAELRGAVAVTSDTRPPPTTYGARDDNDGNTRRTKRNRNMDSQEQYDGVDKVAKALDRISERGTYDSINRLIDKRQKLRNEWRMEKKKNHIVLLRTVSIMKKQSRKQMIRFKRSKI
jgi:hypothetical protein